jgi:hypothetical protein
VLIISRTDICPHQPLLTEDSAILEAQTQFGPSRVYYVFYLVQAEQLLAGKDAGPAVNLPDDKTLVQVEDPRKSEDAYRGIGGLMPYRKYSSSSFSVLHASRPVVAHF